MTRVLSTVAIERGYPKTIVLDNSPEMRSLTDVAVGARSRSTPTLHPAGKTGAKFIHRKLQTPPRDECLNENDFTSLSDAQLKLANWRENYNRHRPHGSLGWQTPEEFAGQFGTSRPTPILHLSSVA